MADMMCETNANRPGVPGRNRAPRDPLKDMWKLSTSVHADTARRVRRQRASRQAGSCPALDRGRQERPFYVFCMGDSLSASTSPKRSAEP